MTVFGWAHAQTDRGLTFELDGWGKITETTAPVEIAGFRPGRFAARATVPATGRPERGSASKVIKLRMIVADEPLFAIDVRVLALPA